MRVYRCVRDNVKLVESIAITSVASLCKLGWRWYRKRRMYRATAVAAAMAVEREERARWSATVAFHHRQCLMEIRLVRVVLDLVRWSRSACSVDFFIGERRIRCTTRVTSERRWVPSASSSLRVTGEITNPGSVNPR